MKVGVYLSLRSTRVSKLQARWCLVRAKFTHLEVLCALGLLRVKTPVLQNASAIGCQRNRGTRLISEPRAFKNLTCPISVFVEISYVTESSHSTKTVLSIATTQRLTSTSWPAFLNPIAALRPARPAPTIPTDRPMLVSGDAIPKAKSGTRIRLNKLSYLKGRE